MITAVLKIKDNTVAIPGLEKYKGKLVEVIVREKRETGARKRMDTFFSLCGKVAIDDDAIERLREESLI